LLPPWFKQLDTNQDGHLSIPEWLRGRRKWEEFHLYDLDGDDRITSDEVLEYLRTHPENQNKDNAKPGRLPRGLPPWFQQLDADRDGQLSLTEWRRGGGSRDEFLRYDLNGDGLITPKEVLWVIRESQRLALDHGRIEYHGAVEEATS